MNTSPSRTKIWAEWGWVGLGGAGWVAAWTLLHAAGGLLLLANTINNRVVLCNSVKAVVSRTGRVDVEVMVTAEASLWLQC